MKKVFMLGDEICLQYRTRVSEFLADVCEVVGPDMNWGSSANAFWEMRFHRDMMKDADLIYWNMGIWDHHRTLDDGLPFLSPDQYLWMNKRFAKQAASHTPRLIFATTTPAGEGYLYDPKGIYGIPMEEWNREIAFYNDIFTPILRNNGVVINDLYTLVREHPEYLSADGILLSEAGVEAAARQTADAIRALLDAEIAENKDGEGNCKERRDKDEACRFNW